MKSCTANGSAQRFMSASATTAKPPRDQIGFLKSPVVFSFDPSRKASHKARRYACKTYFEGPILDSLGRQPPPRAKPGNHWHRLLAHGCRISGPKFVQEFKLSTASPGYKKIAPRQAFGSHPRPRDAAQLQKQAPAPGAEPLDHVRADRRNHRRWCG